jgi:hypothetical protein
MSQSSNSRDDVLALLRGERRDRVPCFSGLISVTAGGRAVIDAIGTGWTPCGRAAIYRR